MKMIDCDGGEWATHATHGRAFNLLLDDTLESKVSKWSLKIGPLPIKFCSVFLVPRCEGVSVAA